MSRASHDSEHNELKRLVDGFFRAVSFEVGERPSFKSIHDLFIAPGLLIKNSGAAPEICNVRQFIDPRLASVDKASSHDFVKRSCRQRQKCLATSRIA